MFIFVLTKENVDKHMVWVINKEESEKYYLSLVFPNVFDTQEV